MDSINYSDTKNFYDGSYSSEKLGAQRKWPNEEFCRFMGRNFFSMSAEERKRVNILEAGSGTGANLRLLAEEGFRAYGIELSDEAVKLAPFLLGKNTSNCEIVCGNMMSLPWNDETFEAVVDVFSSYCLNEEGYQIFIDEVYRTLRRGGKYFSYTPSKGSDAFVNYEPAKKIDASTLNGIYRESSPYYGNFYPFRFMDAGDIEKFFAGNRFKIDYLEKVHRTYRYMQEKFEFLVFEATKL